MVRDSFSENSIQMEKDDSDDDESVFVQVHVPTSEDGIAGWTDRRKRMIGR